MNNCQLRSSALRRALNILTIIICSLGLIKATVSDMKGIIVCATSLCFFFLIKKKCDPWIEYFVLSMFGFLSLVQNNFNAYDATFLVIALVTTRSMCNKLELTAEVGNVIALFGRNGKKVLCTVYNTLDRDLLSADNKRTIANVKNIQELEAEPLNESLDEFLITKSSSGETAILNQKIFPWECKINKNDQMLACGKALMETLDNENITNIRISNYDNIYNNKLDKFIERKNSSILLTLKNEQYNNFVFQCIPDFRGIATSAVWRYFGEQLPFAVIISNKSGSILQFNSRCRKLLNKAGVTELETSFNNFPQEIKVAFKKALSEPGKHFEIEKKDSASSGPILSVCMGDMNVNTDNKDDNNAYFVGIMEDITDRKISQMNSAHSQKMRALGELAGGISHDFNNLLTAIIGYCDLLLERYQKGDPTFSEVMQIKQSADRGASLIKQLLTISRKQVMRLEKRNISEVVSDLSDMIRRFLGENIKLNISLSSNWSAMVDIAFLEQVILNISLNARDAMTGNGNLSISVQEILIENNKVIQGNTDMNYMFNPNDEKNIKNGEYISIEIKDTGTGIKQESMPKIFAPFYSTKEDYGFGLGLSNSLEIIKQSKGYILLNSKINVGSSFFILLPRVTKGLKVKEESSEKNDATELSGTGNILIIEDENIVRSLIANALRIRGYCTVTATSGNEALEIVQSIRKLDLIISDITMPGLNGPETVKLIKEEHPKASVIFMSGYAQEHPEESKNDYNFISKPFTIKDLAIKIKKILQEKNS